MLLRIKIFWHVAPLCECKGKTTLPKFGSPSPKDTESHPRRRKFQAARMIGRLVRPEKSVWNYHQYPCKSPEEYSSQVGRSIIMPLIFIFFNFLRLRKAIWLYIYYVMNCGQEFFTLEDQNSLPNCDFSVNSHSKLYTEWFRVSEEWSSLLWWRRPKHDANHFPLCCLEATKYIDIWFPKVREVLFSK